jgi:hypothetical protein
MTTKLIVGIADDDIEYVMEILTINRIVISRSSRTEVSSA